MKRIKKLRMMALENGICYDEFFYKFFIKFFIRVPFPAPEKPDTTIRAPFVAKLMCHTSAIIRYSESAHEPSRYPSSD